MLTSNKEALAVCRGGRGGQGEETTTVHDRCAGAGILMTLDSINEQWAVGAGQYGICRHQGPAVREI
jgi:hypothetical protein